MNPVSVVCSCVRCVSVVCVRCVSVVVCPLLCVRCVFVCPLCVRCVFQFLLTYRGLVGLFQKHKRPLFFPEVCSLVFDRRPPLISSYS